MTDLERRHSPCELVFSKHRLILLVKLCFGFIVWLKVDVSWLLAMMSGVSELKCWDQTLFTESISREASFERKGFVKHGSQLKPMQGNATRRRSDDSFVHKGISQVFWERGWSGVKGGRGAEVGIVG